MTAKLGTKNILAKLLEVHGDTYDFSRVTADTRHCEVEIGCKEHGFVRTSLHNLLKGQKGCVLCKGSNISKARRLPEGDFVSRFKSMYPEGFEYSKTEYVNMATDVTISCLKHGDFQVLPLNVLRGDRSQPCWKCFAGSKGSKPEQELLEWCQTLGVEVISRTKKIIPPKEIDIWIPEFRLGIELHGLYWHSEDPKGCVTKYRLAKDKGIRLIQVFEDEWRDKKEIVKDLILAKLGMRTTIYARKTEVVVLTPKESNAFYVKWHIAGATKGCKYVGLKLDGELVAALTLSKSRYTEHSFEIARYAASCNVVGGFDKLLSHLSGDLENVTLVTYMDLRFGTGNKYRNAGFKYLGDTSPDYWWFRQKHRLPRYKTQKHLLRIDPIFSEHYKDELSEREICLAAGYLRVYGTGHQKWVRQM